jgi:hypothetical protein
MNGYDDVCVVCGELSAALICDECQNLIGAKRLRAEPSEQPPLAALLGGGDRE